MRGLGGEATVGGVRSHLVVVAAPAPDDSAGLGHTGKHLLVQALVAEPADEALDKGILLRLAERDVVPQDADPVGPFQHGPRDHLGAVVADNHRRSAAPGDHSVALANEKPTCHRPVGCPCGCKDGTPGKPAAGR